MGRKHVFGGVVLVAVLISGVVAAKSFMAPGGKTPDSSAGSSLKEKGPANAPVQLVEFSDFQCPACRASQDVLRSFLTRYPDKIHLVFRHFPLSGHQWSGVAHQAAECANRQGRFWEYHDMLYAKQPEWALPENPTAKFIEYAKTAGLNLDQFATCLSDQKVIDVIMEEKEMGKKLQINSTPTFFMNGQRMVGHIQLASEGEKIIQGLSKAPAEQTSKP